MFKREMGALIDEKGFIWDIIIGNSASLLYPDWKIWEMSKFASKIILAHTHPPYCTSLSQEDFTTLKAWSFALPNKIEMWIICRVNRQIMIEQNKFKIETLDSWIKRGKVGERRMRFESRPYISFFRKPWISRLIELSYK